MSIHKGKPTKDGRCYYFRKSKNNKQYTSKKYLTKKECEDALSSFVLKNENPINKRFDLIAIDYFDNLKRKPSTINSYIKAYRTHIKPYFGKSYINHINTQDIAKWHEYMLKKKKLTSYGNIEIENTKLSVSYMNKCYHILKNIFDYAIKNYSLLYNPVSMYGHFESEPTIKKDNIVFITFEEFKRFISVIDDPLWFAYFNFLFYADTRKGEAMALHWNNVDFDSNKITIKTTLQVDIKGKIFETTTKNNKERIIIMNNKLYDILKSYKESQMSYADFSDNWYVFGGPVPISKTTSDRMKHKYFELAGVKEITNHQFRHSLTTILIQEYVKQQQKNNVKIDKYAFLSALANRNGHTVEIMMKHYAYLFPDTEQSQVIDLLNNLEK